MSCFNRISKNKNKLNKEVLVFVPSSTVLVRKQRWCIVERHPTTQGTQLQRTTRNTTPTTIANSEDIMTSKATGAALTATMVVTHESMTCSTSSHNDANETIDTDETSDNSNEKPPTMNAGVWFCRFHVCLVVVFSVLLFVDDSGALPWLDNPFVLVLFSVMVALVPFSCLWVYKIQNKMKDNDSNIRNKIDDPDNILERIKTTRYLMLFRERLIRTRYLMLSTFVGIYTPCLILFSVLFVYSRSPKDPFEAVCLSWAVTFPSEAIAYAGAWILFGCTVSLLQQLQDDDDHYSDERKRILAWAEFNNQAFLFFIFDFITIIVFLMLPSAIYAVDVADYDADYRAGLPVFLIFYLQFFCTVFY